MGCIGGIQSRAHLTCTEIAGEPKIVQQAVTRILNQIYETDFLGYSYGFRPGRSQHQALDALTVGDRKEEGELDIGSGRSGIFGSYAILPPDY